MSTIGSKETTINQTMKRWVSEVKANFISFSSQQLQQNLGGLRRTIQLNHHIMLTEQRHNPGNLSWPREWIVSYRLIT